MYTKRKLILVLYFVLSTYALNAQQLLEKTIFSEGNLRTYSVYIPAIYQENSYVPLLFNFENNRISIAGLPANIYVLQVGNQIKKLIKIE